MYRIYIVEDDAVIAREMKKHLESWGFEVFCAEDFGNITAEFTALDPQLVLMDISLPFFNGYHWCAQIRGLSKVPIIFISSSGDNMNIVMAMSMGGDDFISKPFDLSVLAAKVQALLRRSYDFAASPRLVAFGEAVLNTWDGTVSLGDKKLELTRNELRILQTLLENRGKIVGRDMLMARLWESDSFVDENALTVNVTRLRRKLLELGLSGLITTRRGEGYLVD